MRREVLDLRVSCTSAGCTWQGELRDLEAILIIQHLSLHVTCYCGIGNTCVVFKIVSFSSSVV